MKKIKIAIIGTGHVAEFHIRAYRELENAEVYAICGSNEGRVKERAGKFGIQNFFCHYEELLCLPEIDAVSVCTVNALHAKITIAALLAGKHVLCEKPMALNEKEALAMKEASEKTGKLLMIGFVRRFGQDTEILKKYISQDFFGHIYHAKATYLRRNGAPGGWFTNKRVSGGGPVIDLGVHVLDLTRYLLGNPLPLTVSAVTCNYLKGRGPGAKSKDCASFGKGEEEVFDVEDFACALIRYDNGCSVLLETSFCLNIEKDKVGIELFGTKAGAKLEDGLSFYSEQAGCYSNTKVISGAELDVGKQFKNQMQHFVNCIENGGSCTSTAEDGMIMMKIVDAIYESARLGREVAI